MKPFFALALAILAGNVFAATEPAQTGVPLDIAKTISITDTSAACGIVPVEVVYEDSHGQRNVATYSVLGNGCGGD
ncbi:DUF2790 domain-containing protein [Pseudomonas sp. S2_A05]